MVVYATFGIPASDFRIGRAFATLPSVEVELDRIVPTATVVVPFVWVRGADPDDVVRVTRADGAVERISVLDREPDGWTLYRVVWNRRFRDAIVSIAESNVALLSGRGTTDGWRFEFRAASGAPLAEFRDSLRKAGVQANVLRLSDETTDRDRVIAGLTAPQREAVRLARERGYFDDPRGATLDELADETGISRQAFSGRLRRALRTIVNETTL